MPIGMYTLIFFPAVNQKRKGLKNEKTKHVEKNVSIRPNVGVTSLIHCSEHGSVCYNR